MFDWVLNMYLFFKGENISRKKDSEVQDLFKVNNKDIKT